MSAWLILLPFLSWSLSSLAAPIPATSSSAVISSNQDVFLSELGFMIGAGASGWQQVRGSTGNPYISTMFKPPEKSALGVQAQLTVRVDQLEKPMSLNDYIQQWKKDYPRFGLDITTAKPIELKGIPAFLIDTINRESDRQLRQVIFLKNRQAVIITCRDHQQTFSITLKSCNEIIRHFRWL